MSAAFQIAQLRHLYALMVNGQVIDTKMAAEGLLGPAIEEMERLLAEYGRVRESRLYAERSDFRSAAWDVLLGPEEEGKAKLRTLVKCRDCDELGGVDHGTYQLCRECDIEQLQRGIP